MESRACAGALPRQVNQIGGALTRPAELGQAAAGYLRDAIAAATRDVYLGLALAAVATLVAVLVIVPRRFATGAGATASSGPAGPAGAEDGGVGSPAAGSASQPASLPAAGEEPLLASGENRHRDGGRFTANTAENRPLMTTMARK
jgi:hypothetical protein